jgi:hypothetical protein
MSSRPILSRELFFPTLWYTLNNDISKLPSHSLPTRYLRPSSVRGEGVARTELGSRNDLCLFRKWKPDGTLLDLSTPRFFPLKCIPCAGEMRPERRQI